MSGSPTEPVGGEIHHLAVRNFEQMMRIMWISGIALGIIGLAIGIVGFRIINAEAQGIPLWYTFTMQMIVTYSILLMLNGFLRRRMLPIYREPITPTEQKQYREWLYSYGRPMREVWIEVLRALAFTVPIVVVIVLYLTVWYIWPMYTDQALVVGGVLIFIALSALVKYYLLPQRAKSEAWYAAHFPDANSQ